MKAREIANSLSRLASVNESINSSTTPRQAVGDKTGQAWLFEIIDDDGALHRVAVITHREAPQ